MSKKLKNLKWESVALEGFPQSVTDNLHGFVGLEECMDYGLDKDGKKTKKKKQQKKRKKSPSQKYQIPIKKVKLSNGFIVESCEKVTPSGSNKIIMKDNTGQKNTENQLKPLQENKDIKSRHKKKNTTKLGENITENESPLTPEDMLSWAEFKLPEEILKALAELSFKKPTKIQQLTLPAAIHGRRDILGAAETGSGKTLAFGLPILTGIMKLKEKAEAGLDVYEIPYKKTSVKKKVQKDEKEENLKIGNQNKKCNNRKQVVQSQNKESSEDGYETGNSSDDENTNEQNKATKDKEFIEEIEVPLRKKRTDIEDNFSDDSEDYVHLSEMLDSDDLAETSDQDVDDDESVITKSDAGDSDNENNKNKLNETKETDGPDDVNEDLEGIGCVKVIDNIELPGHVSTKTGKPLYALILTPTRELAIQISRHLIAAAKYTGIKVATIVGGMASVKQERVLRSGPEVVVATPGRLWELISQGQPHLQQLDSVKFLAIDETDRMVERGHFEELQPLLERLNADDARRSTRQNFVFSATLTMVHELPAHMRRKKVTKRGKLINRKIEKMTPQQKIKNLVTMIGMTDPKVVDITTQNLGTAETLTECRIACAFEHKDAYLYYILKRHPGRTIVFCNSIGCVKRLSQLLSLLKCRPLPLHAAMPQRQRLKNLERFRDDPRGVVIATDVAARGLDIPNVDHVIHYQVPRTAENYVHRSGRTARASKEGLTILIMDSSEAYLYAKLCRTLNKTTELPTFPVEAHVLSSMKELIAVARELDALTLRKRRSAQERGWRDKIVKDMDIIVDEDDLPVKQTDPSIDKALKAKQRQLESILSRPLFPKVFSFKYPTLNNPDALKETNENALQVMKKAIESGEQKREKRKSKNAPLLKLEKMLKK